MEDLVTDSTKYVHKYKADAVTFLEAVAFINYVQVPEMVLLMEVIGGQVTNYVL